MWMGDDECLDRDFSLTPPRLTEVQHGVTFHRYAQWRTTAPVPLLTGTVRSPALNRTERRKVNLQKGVFSK